MVAFVRRTGLAAAVFGLVAAGQASAQENLDSGKTPAQLFVSDCAICHKTPQSLSKAGKALGGLRGLQAFLREHYTASREAAAAIAAYVQAADRGSSPGEKTRAAKPKDKGKPGETQAAKPKTEPIGAETNPGDGKPPASAPAEAKADPAKPDSKADSKSDANSDPAAKPDSEKKSD